MASATPDLRLPSRPQSITALWPVPNCTAWWHRHLGVNNLPRVVAWRCTGRESNQCTCLSCVTGTYDRQSNYHLQSLLSNQLSVPVAKISIRGAHLSFCVPVKSRTGWISQKSIALYWRFERYLKTFLFVYYHLQHCSISETFMPVHYTN